MHCIMITTYFKISNVAYFVKIYLTTEVTRLKFTLPLSLLNFYVDATPKMLQMQKYLHYASSLLKELT